MMRAALPIAASAAALFAATALAQSAPALPSPALEVRKTMIDGVNPAALAIWDVSNSATNDEGALDPALMDAAAWGKLEEAAQMLQFHARRMADAQAFAAGGPDLTTGELPPGVASKEQIQAMIDSDPDGFRASAAHMAGQAGALLEAVRMRDTHAAGDLASGIDGDCQSCHERYWYPQAERATDRAGSIAATAIRYWER